MTNSEQALKPAQGDGRQELDQRLGLVNRLLEALAAREAALQESESRSRAIADNASALIWLSGTDRLCHYFNRVWLEFTGRSLEQEAGNGWAEGVHPEDFDRCLATYVAAFDARQEFTMEYRLRRFDGEYRWLTDHGVPRYDDQGAFLGYIGSCIDVSERMRGEERFRTLMEKVAGIAVQGCAPDGTVTFWNRASELLYGYRADEALGANLLELLIPAEARAGVAEAMARMTASGQPMPAAELVLQAKDGSTVPVFSSHALVHPIGRSPELFWLGIDLTERKRAEEKLHLAASVFTHAREGIVITDAEGNIVDVNETFTHITGYSRDEVLGRNPRVLGSGRHDPAFFAALWHSLLEDGHWTGEIWNRRKSGEVYVETKTISAVRDAQGRTRQYVALFSDITQIKDHERQLEHIAHYDALTALPNRVLLADRLHQAMSQTLRRGDRLAVAYLDLDGFKTINDRHGHEAGDQLLMTLAGNMKQALREGDTLARLGGDEFVAVLLELPDAAASMPILGRLLAAAALPVHCVGLSLQVSASVGVTFYPQPDEVDGDQLLRQADQAMYQAKLAGRNRCHVFDADKDRSARGHYESLDRIRRALAAREFVLHYQPKVNLRTGAVTGVEALIRWQHPDKGLLPPSVFLPVIEDHPLSVDVGEWVIESALDQMQRWQEAGREVPVSVNVAARQMQQTDFVERLRALLAAHPAVAPHRLELELLETSALEDLARASRIIEACREIGVGCALDDFGTGYSSLSYLKRLPVRLIKIDRSFVRDMLDDPDDLAILEGVLRLSTAFRREVIAEGVETVEHGEMLLQLGCELAQGFGIARPMPAQALPGWLDSWRPEPAWAGLKPVARDLLPLLVAGVEHRVWLDAVGRQLAGGSAPAPVLDPARCRLGVWLQSAGPLHLATNPAYRDLESLHRRTHALAQELSALHAAGRGAQAQARKHELEALRDAVLALIKALVRGGPA
jgi:diguanylate cyclase (GGDEF)-like protein/PAS domain S-box-containing protein